MFNFGLKKVIAPVSGTAIDISKIKDDAFSQKMLGDGLGIIPKNGDVFAPFNGTVVHVSDTKHAICLESDDGFEILLHFGINTAILGDSAFDVFVKVGQKVSISDKLMKANIDFIKSQGLDSTCCVIATNFSVFKKFKVITGDVLSQKSTIIEYK